MKRYLTAALTVALLLFTGCGDNNNIENQENEVTNEVTTEFSTENSVRPETANPLDELRVKLGDEILSVSQLINDTTDEQTLLKFQEIFNETAEFGNYIKNNEEEIYLSQDKTNEAVEQATNILNKIDDFKKSISYNTNNDI